MIINKERFEAWLLSQPDDRPFNFCNPQACVMCEFIRETSNFRLGGVGDNYIRDHEWNMFDLPDWFGGNCDFEKKLMHIGVIGSTGTYATLKDRWRKLNPDESGQDLPQQPQATDKPSKPLCSP